MALTQIERAEKRMQEKWHDLVMMEQQGASQRILERMYNAYIRSVEEYNRCTSQEHSICQVQSSPVQSQSTYAVASPQHHRHGKKAS